MAAGDPRLNPRVQRTALVTLCAVLFITFLDNTVASVTLADIQSRLHVLGTTALAACSSVVVASGSTSPASCLLLSVVATGVINLLFRR